MTRQLKGRQITACGVAFTTAPMEAKLVTALPEDAGWQFEPKWDGFRCLAFKQVDKVELRTKSGKSLSRYTPRQCTFEQLAPPARPSRIARGILRTPVATAQRQGHAAQHARA